MSAAAHPLPADRICDWIEELERILSRFDEMSDVAKGAIGSVVQSILQEIDATNADVSYARTLWARYNVSSDAPR